MPYSQPGDRPKATFKTYTDAFRSQIHNTGTVHYKFGLIHSLLTTRMQESNGNGKMNAMLYHSDGNFLPSPI